MGKKFTLDDCVNTAAEKGGKCLSTEYVNNATKMLWECSKGHQWYAIYINIRVGKWCKECAYESMRRGLKDAQKLAESMGGKCLSEKYINNNTKMLWECNDWHQWETPLRNIQQGHWCRECKNNSFKKTLRDAQIIAAKMNGKCLSEKYINNRSNMLWECVFGHKWNTTYTNIQQGNWCPECNLNNMRNTINDAHKLALTKNGKCLSKIYKNNRSYLVWECEYGHTWEAIYNNILKGKWCPYCKTKTQNKLYKIIEKIFPNIEIIYNSISLDWLKNPETNRKLEIDLWVPSLKLAIEYDGKQHYEPVRFGGISQKRAEENFKHTKQRDQAKNKLIKKHPKEVKYFIRFRYNETIDRKHVTEKLKKYGVL